MVWCTFWRLEQILANLPKLSCGFDIVDPLYMQMWMSACWVKITARLPVRTRLEATGVHVLLDFSFHLMELDVQV